MVLGGEHLPQRFLLFRIREGRRTYIVKNEYGGGLFVFVRHVGDLVWVDSGDFHDKREGLGDWDCLCVVESVGFPLVTSLTELIGWGQLRVLFLEVG